MPIIFSDVDWCCQEQTCLCHKKEPMLLKHLKCHILQFSEVFEDDCPSKMYLCLTLKTYDYTFDVD